MGTRVKGHKTWEQRVQEMGTRVKGHKTWVLGCKTWAQGGKGPKTWAQGGKG